MVMQIDDDEIQAAIAAAKGNINPNGQAPYDRERMTHKVKVPTATGGYRWVERPVAATLREAQETGQDYYHPGGPVQIGRGQRGPERPAGWVLYGTKWQNDSPHVRVGIVLGSDDENRAEPREE